MEIKDEPYRKFSDRYMSFCPRCKEPAVKDSRRLGFTMGFYCDMCGCEWRIPTRQATIVHSEEDLVISPEPEVPTMLAGFYRLVKKLFTDGRRKVTFDSELDRTVVVSFDLQGVTVDIHEGKEKRKTFSKRVHWQRIFR